VFRGAFQNRLERGSIGCDRKYGDQRRFIDDDFLWSYTPLRDFVLSRREKDLYQDVYREKIEVRFLGLRL